MKRLSVVFVLFFFTFCYRVMAERSSNVDLSDIQSDIAELKTDTASLESSSNNKVDLTASTQTKQGGIIFGGDVESGGNITISKPNPKITLTDQTGSTLNLSWDGNILTLDRDISFGQLSIQGGSEGHGLWQFMEGLHAEGGAIDFAGTVSMDDNVISDVSNPTNPLDASNKTYTDTSISFSTSDKASLNGGATSYAPAFSTSESTKSLTLNISNTNYIELSASTQTKIGGIVLGGNVKANSFVGDGSQLTGISGGGGGGVSFTTHTIDLVSGGDVIQSTSSSLLMPQFIGWKNDRISTWTITDSEAFVDVPTTMTTQFTVMYSTGGTNANAVFAPIHSSSYTISPNTSNTYVGVPDVLSIIYPGYSLGLQTTISSGTSPSGGIPASGLWGVKLRAWKMP